MWRCVDAVGCSIVCGKNKTKALSKAKGWRHGQRRARAMLEAGTLISGGALGPGAADLGGYCSQHQLLWCLKNNMAQTESIAETAHTHKPTKQWTSHQLII